MSPQISQKVIFSPKVVSLAKSVGEFIQYWGFNKNHGQIWCLIFLSQNPLDGNTLAKALGVSKASISLAIQELLFYEVIQTVAKGQRRTLYYRSHPDMAQVIINILKNRELPMIQKSALSIEEIKKSHDCETMQYLIINHNNLDEMSAMVNQALIFLEFLISAKLDISSCDIKSDDTKSDDTDSKKKN